MCVKLAMLYRQDTTTLTVWDTYSCMSKFLGEITGIFLPISLGSLNTLDHISLQLPSQ